LNFFTIRAPELFRCKDTIILTDQGFHRHIIPAMISPGAVECQIEAEMFYFSYNFMEKVFPLIINRISIASLCIYILCSCASLKKDERYYEKQEAKLAKQEQQDYEHRLKEHNKMQSKQTLKMMKETEREAKKLNKRRKR